jgi:hypothetical protein
MREVPVCAKALAASRPTANKHVKMRFIFCMKTSLWVVLPKIGSESDAG